jgi:hypothetical protein
MTSTAIMTSTSIQNSLDKTNKMLETSYGLYERVKAIRPLILKLIRLYHKIEHEWGYSTMWIATYEKICEMIKILRERVSEDFTIKECNYINKFIKNIKKLKKMCENTTIIYYSMLPDNIPIDVRTHCLQFISNATIRNY